jgi:hypothetical protein
LYIKDFQKKNVTCAWLNRIRGILNDCGMSYIWNRQTCISDKWLAHVTFLFWKSFIYNSLYDNDEIFDWFPKMSFDQYEIIRTLMSMSIGYLPNSP